MISCSIWSLVSFLNILYQDAKPGRNKTMNLKAKLYTLYPPPAQKAIKTHNHPLETLLQDEIH